MEIIMIKNNKINHYIYTIAIVLSLFCVQTNKALSDSELAGAIISRIGFSIATIGTTIWVGGKAFKALTHNNNAPAQKTPKNRITKILRNAFYIGSGVIVGTHLYAHRATINTTVTQGCKWLIGQDIQDILTNK